MIILRFVILVGILCTSILIGMLMAKKYTNRLNELKEMKKGIHILETKLKFTYETLPKVFEDIGKSIDRSVGYIFTLASENMMYTSAGNSWSEALTQTVNERKTNMKNEDIETLKSLSKLLGKTDMQGQISQIELVDAFLDTQIQEADLEKRKNDKMYKSLGIVAGLTLVVLLI